MSPVGATPSKLGSAIVGAVGSMRSGSVGAAITGFTSSAGRSGNVKSVVMFGGVTVNSAAWLGRVGRVMVGAVAVSTGAMPGSIGLMGRNSGAVEGSVGSSRFTGERVGAVSVSGMSGVSGRFAPSKLTSVKPMFAMSARICARASSACSLMSPAYCWARSIWVFTSAITVSFQVLQRRIE